MALPERYRDVADILMVGEVEHTWPQCIEDIEKGVHKNAYHTTETVELDESPMPRFELIKVKDYMSIGLQTTRGCPFQCEFCDIITLYGRKVRTKPVPQVLKEVERVLELGCDRMFFVDDNFVGDPRYAAELMEALALLRKGMKKPFYFSIQATINVAHSRRLLRQLYDGGCRSMFIGIETPRTSSLQETHKFQNVRKNLLEEVELIQSNGISVYSGLMVGFDHDDETIFQEQVDFINDAKIPVPFPSKVGALPRTPLYHRMLEEGRLIEEKEFQANTYFTNILPKLMTMEELDRGFLSMTLALFDPVNYTNRVMGELSRLERAGGDVSNYRTPVVFLGFFWVLMWYLFDPNRKKLLGAFRRLFPRVFWRHPQVADAALQRLVHYRHICRYVSFIEEFTASAASRAPRELESVGKGEKDAVLAG